MEKKSETLRTEASKDDFITFLKQRAIAQKNYAAFYKLLRNKKIQSYPQLFKTKSLTIFLTLLKNEFEQKNPKQTIALSTIEKTLTDNAFTHFWKNKGESKNSNDILMPLFQAPINTFLNNRENITQINKAMTDLETLFQTVKRKVWTWLTLREEAERRLTGLYFAWLTNNAKSQYDKYEDIDIVINTKLNSHIKKKIGKKELKFEDIKKHFENLAKKQ